LLIGLCGLAGGSVARSNLFPAAIGYSAYAFIAIADKTA